MPHHHAPTDTDPGATPTTPIDQRFPRVHPRPDPHRESRTLAVERPGRSAPSHEGLHCRSARAAAAFTRGFGSASSLSNASSEASDVGLWAAITFAAISRTRQCSSEHAVTTAGSASGSHTYKKASRAQVRGQYPSGPPHRSANTPGAALPPRTHNRSASARVPARTSTHLRTIASSPSRPAAEVTRWRGVDSWTMTPLCHPAEGQDSHAHTSDHRLQRLRHSASLRRLSRTLGQAWQRAAHATLSGGEMWRGTLGEHGRVDPGWVWVGQA